MIDKEPNLPHQYQKIADELLADYELARREVQNERKTLRQAKDHHQAALQAQAEIQEIAKQIQQQAHARLAGVVSRCLKAVFGPDAYTFEIQFSKKRGKTEARLVFIREGKAIDPCRAAGGGVVDVAAFALRLAALMLTRPRPRKLLVLDECCKHLSSSYRPAFRELVEVLAKEMGVQFIMVTHSRQLRAGKVIELG